MRLRVCLCLSNSFQWITRRVLSRCKHLSGIEWILADPSTEEQNALSSKFQSSDVIMSESTTLGQQFHHLGSNVKWVHTLWAGVREITKHSSTLPFTLTRHVGSYGSQIAEYTIAQIINREKCILGAYKNQLQQKWGKEDGRQERLLSSLSIGILGVGAIGSKVAEVCKSFGMTVWGMTRSEPVNKCPHVDHYRLTEDLPEILANSDYVCSVLPSTPLTAGLLNEDVLKACSPKKSVLINVGRGDVVSEAAVVKAVREGWLGGAILDTFEEEPLPQDSELWRMPEVVVTPHVAGITVENCADVFVENLQLFMEGKELKYIVDPSRGY